MSVLDPSMEALYRELALQTPGDAALAGLAGPSADSPQAARRPELARLLATDHRQDPAARQALDQLALPGTPVLVTGQQAGLLLGPGYTLHKCLALLALRDRVLRLTGRPAVAVFWAETNDHDWAEAALVRIPGRADFRLALPGALEGRSVGRIPFDAGLKAPLRSLLAELEADWPPELHALARTCLDTAVTPGAFFCDLLREVTRGSGLLVLDPSQPGLRELAGPFFRQLHALGDEPARAVAAGAGLLADRGKVPPVAQAAPFPWFVDVDGRRQRPTDAMQAKASVSGPADRLSPDVISRPLLQDWLLGTSLSLLGPSELLYNGQIAGLHGSLGLNPPLLWPRPRLRWIAAREKEELENLGLDPAAPPVPGQPWPEAWLSNLEGMAEALARSRDLAAMAGQVRRMAEFPAGGETRPDLLGQAEKVASALAQFDERLQQAARRRHKGRLKEIHRITDWLDHPGLPQERRVNSLALLARAGVSRLDPALWAAIDALAPDTRWLVHHEGALVHPSTPQD
jgi:uncharacterized protein YllA (UPF0747 family)